MNARFLAITGLVLAAAASRLIPHPHNFTPIAAMALFGGACLSRKWLAFLVPLAAMALSDVVLFNLQSRPEDLGGYLAVRAVVYACFAVMVCVGFWLRDRRKPLYIAGAYIAGAALAGSVFFFVVTNFAVWVLGQGLSFPRTPAGLLASYTAAIPFFRYTVAGDLLFSGVLFGGFALLEHWLPSLRESGGTSALPIEQEEYATADR